MLQVFPSLFVSKPKYVFSPKDISGLYGWFDASSIGLTDGSVVDTWADSSTNARDLAVNNTTNRPVYKTNILNGFPIVRYNGAGSTWLIKSSWNLSQPSTAFFVAKQSAKTTVGVLQESGIVPRNVFWLTTSGFLEAYAGTDYLGSTDWSGAFHIFSVIYNSTTSFVYVDGTQVYSGDLGTQSQPNLVLGSDAGGQHMNGDFAEAFFYNSALNSTNHGLAIAGMKTKYAIA